MQKRAINRPKTFNWPPCSSVTRSWIQERKLTRIPRLTGEPIMHILCKKTGNLVGYLYQWNNGDLQPAWFDGEVQDVLYKPIATAA